MRIRLLDIALLCVLHLSGCTSNPYYIGAACPGANGPSKAGIPCGSAGASATDTGVSFAIDLDQSGVSRLPDTLSRAGGSLPAVLRLRGETATASGWPADDGGAPLQALGTPSTGLEAPFTDGTRAVGIAAAAASYTAQSGELGSPGALDDFALELVLRATPGATLADKSGAGSGWAVNVLLDGTLALELQDAQSSVQVESEPLVANAWYECLFWVSRSAGGQAYCNGRAGDAADLSALGSLSSASPLLIGGGSGDATAQLAYLALFDAKNGLGDASTWSDISRQRFASLTGVSPRVALGSVLPAVGLRDSAAYLDLQRAAGGGRNLFLVGPDWPRIACRSDVSGVQDCGYLSEPLRTRWIPPEASDWSASELTVLANQADFVDGERRMTALVPSTTDAPHGLTWSGMYGGTRQALSGFLRRERGRFVALSAGGLGPAIFDLDAGTVVSAPPSVRATIEPWQSNLFRCAYIFTPDSGVLSYDLALLGDASGAPFSGDGASAWLDVAGLQLDVGEANPGSLFAADTEQADQLTFVGSDGNLPTSSSVSQTLRVLLPAGPRLTDQAVLSLNLGGEFDNQVQLYVRGDTGELKFLGLRGGVTHWAFDHPASFTDGARHAVEADWSTRSETLTVDGVPAMQNALIANSPAFSSDRIDIGFSSSSSGSLEGLVAGIQIRAAMP